MTTATPEITTVAKKIGFFADPFHLILTGLLVISLLGGVYFFESKKADVLQAKADAANTLAQAAQKAALDSQTQNAATQLADKATQQALAAANAQLAQANQQLQSANAQLRSQLAQRQSNDASLPPSGQALRWQVLVPQATVTPNAAGFQVDPAGALATIDSLEELATDRQSIVNLNSQIDNLDSTIVNDNKALSTEQAAHASDVTNDARQLAAAVDENKKVTAQFNAYKAKSHRNFFRTVLISLGVGVGIGLKL